MLLFQSPRTIISFPSDNAYETCGMTLSVKRDKRLSGICKQHTSRSNLDNLLPSLSISAFVTVVLSQDSDKTKLSKSIFITILLLV